MDQNGLPFVEAPDGGIDFGHITVEQNLPPAPIRLSIGDRNNGLMHIEIRHGDQIRKAGFETVVAFVAYVARNYNSIKKGNAYRSAQKKAKPIWSNLPTSITIPYGCNYQWMTPIGMSIAQAFCQKGPVERRKTSGLLPNCRMRNRLPVILRNLQQMPIKRQAQTVLYPMFPKAKIQLFHNTQVHFRKNTENYHNNVKNYYLCPFINVSHERRLAVSRVKN